MKFGVGEIDNIYQKGGEFWLVIGMCPSPTMIMKNIKTDEIEHIVPDSKQGKSLKLIGRQGMD